MRAVDAPPVWVFAYGSLIFRPGFPFVARRRAYAHGFARRFYQASTDHRGTPERPGRVVTLVPTEGARCGGVAYAIDGHAAPQILTMLDHRERGGYVRARVEVVLDADEAASVETTEALTWIAWPDNPNHAGEASIEAIAQVARESVGPSGSNREYIERLARVLREIEVDDPHVFALERALQGSSGAP